MRRMRRILLVLATTVAAVTMAGPSVAADQHRAASAAAQCYTWFDPQAPNGAPMWHHYDNCGPYSVFIAPAYIQPSGSIVVYVNACREVPSGQGTIWYHSFTYPGVNYTTVTCFNGPVT